MLVVVQPTQIVMADTDTRACAFCGSNFTDRPICKNSVTGDVGVLQFEHDNFDEKRLAHEIITLTKVMDRVTCHVCEEDQNRDQWISPHDFVIKILRLDPTTHRFKVTCSKCAELGICPCCSGESGD